MAQFRTPIYHRPPAYPPYVAHPGIVRTAPPDQVSQGLMGANNPHRPGIRPNNAAGVEAGLQNLRADLQAVSTDIQEIKNDLQGLKASLNVMKAGIAETRAAGMQIGREVRAVRQELEARKDHRAVKSGTPPKRSRRNPERSCASRHANHRPITRSMTSTTKS